VIYQPECNTISTPSTVHAHKAASHLLGARMEIVRALRLHPEESPLPNRPSPIRYKLQQVAGAISLLIGIVEPLAKDEPAEISPTASDQQMDVSQ
jgi:hypothetical protein